MSREIPSNSITRDDVVRRPPQSNVYTASTSKRSARWKEKALITTSEFAEKNKLTRFVFPKESDKPKEESEKPKVESDKSKGESKDAPAESK